MQAGSPKEAPGDLGQLLADDVTWQCAPDLELHLSPNGECCGRDSGVNLGPASLVLHAAAAFTEPKTFSAALEDLQPMLTGRQLAMDLMNVVIGMMRAGLLVRSDGTAKFSQGFRAGFGSEPAHVAMLDDSVRTRGWLDAIRATVRGGDVVLEVGTGTGVLAVAAAQAGARRVYTIEETAIGSVAQAMIDDNGFSDRVTLLRGQSATVQLPELADVVISEIIGNQVFDERILETLGDVRRRLAKPGARFLPRRLSVSMRLVAIDDLERCRFKVCARHAREWESRYGMRFESLAQASRAGGPSPVTLSRSTAARARPLSDAGLVAAFDFDQPHSEVVEAELILTAKGGGLCDGVVVTFDVEVAPGLHVRSDPWATSGPDNWRTAFWLFPERRPLRAGESVRLSYRYDGEPSLELRA